ncbi:MAG: S-methyl-5-thioribose-1-phosphate isomerase [Candidatus Brocadiia bacterium]
MPVETIRWSGGPDGHVELIDQTRLPVECEYIECRNKEDIWEAIRMLRIRGAPAIGIAAAMGLVLGLQESEAEDFPSFMEDLQRIKDYLETSRPTAVNLFWALERMESTAVHNKERPPAELHERLLQEAQQILQEDRETCRAIGRNGAELLPDGAAVLTHCNAGGLATADYGTALAVLFAAQEKGKEVSAFADETRPLLQGARLTTWELQEADIPVTLICDSMAPVVIREGRVDAVVVGADRIASNGDVANKIGTYGVSLAAREHGIPFYVAAPVSTFDMELDSGEDIPIEERDPEEITCWGDHRTAPENTDVYNPAFDVTPASHVMAIITERGVIKNPDSESIRSLVARSS